MKIINIIEGLNQYYESFKDRKKGYFIAHKTIDTNPVVKALKVYNVNLCFVQDDSKEVIFSISIPYRVVDSDSENELYEILISSIVKSLLEYTNSNKFKELCYDRNE